MNIETFKNLTRDEMYGELRAWAPAKAKGHSRSAKATLIALYREVLAEGLFTAEELNASIPPIPPRVYPSREETDAAYNARVAALPVAEPFPDLGDDPYEVPVGDEPIVNVPDMGLGMRAATMVQPDTHVHGPGCGHEEMERINPEMPDGVIALPPQQAAREFVFKEGDQERPMSAKQEALWARFIRDFEGFCKNAAHSGLRRDAKAGIYALKVAGVIAHPQFAATLAKGAGDVRDARRLARQGVSANG